MLGLGLGFDAQLARHVEEARRVDALTGGDGGGLLREVAAEGVLGRARLLPGWRVPASFLGRMHLPQLQIRSQIRT